MTQMLVIATPPSAKLSRCKMQIRFQSSEQPTQGTADRV